MQLQEAVHTGRPENQNGHTMHMCDLWACVTTMKHYPRRTGTSELGRA